MQGHSCYICSAVKYGGATKYLTPDISICSKGLCRNIFELNIDFSIDLLSILELSKFDYNMTKG